ncbi:MAG: ATP-binding protein [Pirellulaceae bacterium]
MSQVSENDELLVQAMRDDEAVGHGDLSALVPATLPASHDIDLATVLEAWQTATDRLQSTHSALREEVRRLSDELEKKNRELARKNRLADLGLVASHVAHEVRNSLVPMKLYLSLLRRQTASDANNLATLDKFASSLTALEATVTDLLHFTAERQPQRRRFPASELIVDVARSLQPQLAAQGIALEFDAADAAQCDADYDMLRRAILNLVLNALDVMPQGGRLALSAQSRADGVELKVADTGGGIDAEAVDRVFEPFFSTKSGGTGLGLVIVARIAEAHGGVAVAANDQHGAVFTLQIPHRARQAA